MPSGFARYWTSVCLLASFGCGRDVSLGGFADTGAGGVADTGGAPSCAEPVSTEQSALLDEVWGFGRLVTGGKEGCVVHVTSLDDSGPGSLRDTAERPEPAWIVFDVSGDLVLSSDIRVASDKTIDGRGQTVTLRDYGLLLDGVNNVVLENLAFSGRDLGDENDAIHLTNATHDVWIDHAELSSYGDGLVDITYGATDVTVSHCRFFEHDMAMLIGNDMDATSDTEIRVTLHHNSWDRIGAYAPRLRFGRVHLVNNLFVEWGNSAAAATMDGEIYSEANLFRAGEDRLALATTAGTDALQGHIESVADRFENGATSDESEPDRVFDPAEAYPYTAEAAGAELERSIAEKAGLR